MDSDDQTVPTPPDRLHMAVSVVMGHYGTDALGGFRWIVDESHRTGMPIGEVITRLVERHDQSL